MKNLGWGLNYFFCYFVLCPKFNNIISDLFALISFSRQNYHFASFNVAQRVTWLSPMLIKFILSYRSSISGFRFIKSGWFGPLRHDDWNIPVPIWNSFPFLTSSNSCVVWSILLGSCRMFCLFSLRRLRGCVKRQSLGIFPLMFPEVPYFWNSRLSLLVREKNNTTNYLNVMY